MSRSAHPSKGDLFCYILDRTPEKSRLIRKTATEQGLTPFEILPREYRNLPLGADLSTVVMPPVEQWLRSFMDAKYVITDSFHGTVFSILFEKPCIVIQNASRGNDRFQSLLKVFGSNLKMGDNPFVNYSLSDSLIIDKWRNASIAHLSSHLY